MEKRELPLHVCRHLRPCTYVVLWYVLAMFRRWSIPLSVWGLQVVGSERDYKCDSCGMLDVLGMLLAVRCREMQGVATAEVIEKGKMRETFALLEVFCRCIFPPEVRGHYRERVLLKTSREEEHWECFDRL
jgi:hypothetical protein